MDQTEVRKPCRSCGEDLAHKPRHRSRDGSYICPQCTAGQNRWDRRMVQKLTDKKTLLFGFYVVLAAIGCGVFWMVLEMMNRPDMGN